MADQDNYVKVRMLVVSGKTDDSQFFDYRPGFFANVVRVEWELETMDVSLAEDAAEYLIKHGYAVRLSPIPEPAPIVQTQEPLVVETIDQPSSAPSSDTSRSDIPPETPAAQQSSSPTDETPPTATTQPQPSSGGRRRKDKAK